MKKVVSTLLILLSLQLSAAAYEDDEYNFYVQDQDLNRGMSYINLFVCRIRNAVGLGQLINDGKYLATISNDLCSFSPQGQDDKNKAELKNSTESETSTQSAVKEVKINEFIVDVTRESNSSPLKAKKWVKNNEGSKDPKFLPLDVYYDFSISKLACSTTVTTNCSKFGNTEFYYSFTADPESSGFTDLASIDPTFTGLNMTQGRTIGMGGIIATDNSIQYVANQGGAGASVSLTSTGDPGSEIIKGIYEFNKGVYLPTFNVGYGPFALRRFFYTDYQNDVHCEKFADAKGQVYKSSQVGGYDFMESPKVGPLLKDSFVGATDTLNPAAAAINIPNVKDYWETQIIPNGFDFQERCFSIKKSEVVKNVHRYGVYTLAGDRFDLENRPFSIKATPAQGSGASFDQMYSYANEHGVYLEERFRPYVNESTVWKNNEWNASDADKAKNYNLRSNYLRAEKRTISYISLDDTHLQQIQLSHHDPYWDAEFKTLGFCGTDGRTALDVVCTHYHEHLGYYDKNLNGLDGDANTKGGFVFNYAVNCVSGSGCNSIELTGADVIQFENTQWISIMSKTYGTYVNTRWMYLWNRDTATGSSIRKETLQNPSSNSSSNGIRLTKHEYVSISDLPTTLYCIERCMVPSQVNTAYTQLLTEAANIKANPNTQSWDCAVGTNLTSAALANCTTPRAPAPSPFDADSGPYIKSDEVNGSGELEFDFDNNGSVDYTWGEAVGAYMDGILDSDKVTYTVSASDGKFYLGSDELSFNSSNATNLNAQPNLNSYLSGAKVENGSKWPDHAAWGLWMDNLVTATELANAECDKTFNYTGTNNDEYQYRAGFNPTQQAELRYCTSKLRDNVSTSYSIRLEARPRYELVEVGQSSPVTFSSSKTMILDIPTTGTAASNYPETERGKRYRLHFNGFDQLHGIPGDVWNIVSGTKLGQFVSSWEPNYRYISRFILPNGTLITDSETGTQYKIKALNGEAYLLGKPVDDVKAALGVSDIPYDLTATIASEDILKNISDSTSPDYIGAFPSKSDLINNGEACSIEGEFDLSCQNTAN